MAPTFLSSSTLFGAYTANSTLNFAVNTEEIFAFLGYAIICFGVVINRRNKTVQVDKVRFAPTLSTISTILIIVCAGLFIYQSFNPAVPNSDWDGYASEWNIMYICNMVTFALMVLGVVLPYAYNTRRINNTPKSVFDAKDPMIKKYVDLDAWELVAEGKAISFITYKVKRYYLELKAFLKFKLGTLRQRDYYAFRSLANSSIVLSSGCLS